MRILVAEDDTVSRKVLEIRLMKLGHEVIAAADGQEAIQLYRLNHPHAVITDWMMPYADGLEVCRAIRSDQRPQYTYIIMLTALNGPEHHIEALSAGADDFMTKPVDPHMIAARLRVAERILGLQRDMARLEGLLPICSYCKRVRDEGDTWREVEEYVEGKTDASFSHALCPDCSKGAG